MLIVCFTTLHNHFI